MAVGALDIDEIKRVYVDPVAQGQGAATALMSRLEALASAAGVDTVRLDASPSSVDFCESVGYQRCNDEILEVDGAVFRFVQMTKRLAPKS